MFSAMVSTVARVISGTVSLSVSRPTIHPTLNRASSISPAAKYLCISRPASAKFRGEMVKLRRSASTPQEK